MWGTPFQLKVWEALLRIPAGQVVAYEDLAQMIGAPGAPPGPSGLPCSAASNPIPLLIPCHRVIRKAGEFGSYRYGSARKKAMLGTEPKKTIPGRDRERRRKRRAPRPQSPFSSASPSRNGLSCRRFSPRRGTTW